jgi:hypothetical protein
MLTLAGLVLTLLAQARKKARRAEVLSFIKEIEAAAKTFQLNYNRWPWEIEGATLIKKLNAADIFAELSPGTSSLQTCSYQPLLNRQRLEYLAIPAHRIKGARVVDSWGNEFEFFWNPDTRSIVIISIGENQKNETLNAAGVLNTPSAQGDDINSL